jgi:hypothetical protein
MQTDNVETLRRYHDLLNETGEPPVSLFHPEVEVHMFDGSPISGPYYGQEGLRQWHVHFRDGLIVRFQGYRDRAEALAAAGLNDARRTT